MTERSFPNFNIFKERVDTFLGSYINKIDAYKHAWMVMTFLFTLSHGQSQVERGFNINDDIMVENLHNGLLIAQRIVYDHMKCNNFEPQNYEIGQKFCASILSAYSKYKIGRDQKEKDTIESEKQQRLKVIESKIHERERKISIVKSTISKLEKVADECYDNAEKLDVDIATLLSKGKAFWKSIKEKKIVLNDVEKKIENLKKEKRKLKIHELGCITRFYPKKRQF